MPPLETMDRKQEAVLWEVVGLDDQAQTLRGAPVELLVRWTYKRSFTRNASVGVGQVGDMIPVDAEVVVDRLVKVGSQMWLGKLVDWLGTGSGVADDEVMQVVNYHTATDLKNRFTRYRLSLAFYRNLPMASG